MAWLVVEPSKPQIGSSSSALGVGAQDYLRLRTELGRRLGAVDPDVLSLERHGATSFGWVCTAQCMCGCGAAVCCPADCQQAISRPLPECEPRVTRAPLWPESRFAGRPRPAHVMGARARAGAAGLWGQPTFSIRALRMRNLPGSRTCSKRRVVQQDAAPGGGGDLDGRGLAVVQVGDLELRPGRELPAGRGGRAPLTGQRHGRTGTDLLTGGVPSGATGGVSGVGLGGDRVLRPRPSRSPCRRPRHRLRPRPVLRLPPRHQHRIRPAPRPRSRTPPPCAGSRR